MFSQSIHLVKDGESHVGSQPGTPLGSPNSADNRAIFGTMTGQVDDDEAALRRRLQYHEKLFGSEHTSTIAVVHELGGFYLSKGRLDDAEAMYRRALGGYETALGPQHASTLVAVRDLGRLYKIQGRYAAAETMFKRVLGGLETNSRPRITSAPDPLYRSGYLSHGQPQLDPGAISPNRTLGSTSPIPEMNQLLVITTIEDLGTLYSDQGRLEDAEQLYRNVNHAT
ncbi:hypothetical protein G7Z17_g8030 [Cylindrodendrum hubeiense]|uniref:Uncharacterized protein n=1 Tax=Cylindrodendrum hubeiense TaxID=595255 RepID=A0A9P5H7W4_9HYPO|nr:hypothetical protein G7Z17_g8030 [Cylindrodendrum hubeiense]